MNVSVVTVSKALSGQKGVSEEVREKIKKLEEQGYRVPEDISVIGFDNYLYPGMKLCRFYPVPDRNYRFSRIRISTGIYKYSCSGSSPEAR